MVLILTTLRYGQSGHAKIQFSTRVSARDTTGNELKPEIMNTGREPAPVTQQSNRRTIITDRYGNLKRFGYAYDDRQRIQPCVIQASYEPYESYREVALTSTGRAGRWLPRPRESGSVWGSTSPLKRAIIGHRGSLGAL